MCMFPLDRILTGPHGVWLSQTCKENGDVIIYAVGLDVLTVTNECKQAIFWAIEGKLVEMVLPHNISFFVC